MCLFTSRRTRKVARALLFGWRGCARRATVGRRGGYFEEREKTTLYSRAPRVSGDTNLFVFIPYQVTQVFLWFLFRRQEEQQQSCSSTSGSARCAAYWHSRQMPGEESAVEAGIHKSQFCSHGLCTVKQQLSAQQTLNGILLPSQSQKQKMSGAAFTLTTSKRAARILLRHGFDSVFDVVGFHNPLFLLHGDRRLRVARQQQSVKTK